VPTYVVLYRFTEQGRKKIKSTVRRAAQIRRENQRRGFNVIGTYWTEGHYDLVSIVDAPNEQAMLSGLFNIAQAGNVSSETLRAHTDREMQRALSTPSGGRRRTARKATGRKTTRKAARRTTRKATARKTTRKAVRRTVRKATRKAVRRTVRKTTRKAVRRTARKTTRKAVRRTARKTTRKAVRRTARKTTRKAVRRTARKTTRKAVRRPARKTARRTTRARRR